MPLVSLGVRVLLAATLVVAGIGKLRDLAGFRRMLSDFGVPVSIVPAMVVLIPAAELTTAVLLMAEGAPQWNRWVEAGTISSLILLSLFTLAIVVNLMRGRRPACRCFGQVSASPIGAFTLARNLILVAAATLLLLNGPGTPLSVAVGRWSEASTDARVMWLGTLLALGLVVGLAEVASSLQARNEALRKRIETLERQLAASSASANGATGLPVGTPAPPFELPVLAGDNTSLTTLTGTGLPLLLIFSSSNCPACGELWRDISRWQRDYAGKLRIAVLGGGSAQVIEMKMMGFEVDDVILAGDSGVFDRYQLPGIPAAVVIRPDGRIDSETVMGPIAIRDLVRRRAA